MGKKKTLNYIHKWNCPVHVLDKELSKLDSRLEVCIFVSYPSGTKRGYFYNPKENNFLISTNTTFLEEVTFKTLSLKARLCLMKCLIALLLR